MRTGIAIGIIIALLASCGEAPKHDDHASAARTDTAFTPEQLAERAIHRRAVEAANWGIPIVNSDMMFQSFVKDGKGAVNQIAYWSRLPDWKNQLLTPNPDAIYFMPFFSTKDVGPIVIEIPPVENGSITGSLTDFWQAALEDVGPAGVDKGRGGRYLILPPGYTGKVPAGYIALPSNTYQGEGLLRSLLKSSADADVAAAVEYGRRIKLYPLSKAANPPPTVFVDMADVIFDGTIPYDVRFFESLDRMVQYEPWIERDRAMIDPLKSIGIEKGKAFAPDARTQGIMQEALAEARAWFDHTYESTKPFYEGGHWFVPGSAGVFKAAASYWSDADSYPIDTRGTIYYYAFTGIRHFGTGQFYFFVTRDKEGEPLAGGSNYRLHVPAAPPVQQYWSVVLYDFATHTLIRDMERSNRSSLQADLEKNADGSVDIYFGPAAPAGKEKNWIPTKAGGRFEALFRFYGPEKPLFEKTWVLPDIGKVK